MTKLKDLRIEKGLTRSKLAEASGIGERVVEAYEQGLRKIDGAKIDTLFSLTSVLGCKISDIIENDDLKTKLKEGGY